MSSDFGYYVGMSVTAFTGTRIVIDPNKYGILEIALLGTFVLAISIVGGVIGAIIQESIHKSLIKWNGKKKQQKQSSEG